MKINIEREIEIPDGLVCVKNCGSNRECWALHKITKTDGSISEVAHCRNFNDSVKWSDRAGFYVKSRECIDASLEYFYGVT
jgi:hypothetical protein